MIFERTTLPDVVLVRPKKHGDQRGYFMETFRANLFRDMVGPYSFVQSNQSKSAERGTVRGLHFQTRPMEQGKLVACVAGRVLDVAVDIRAGSPNFGQHVAVELSAENGARLWVPPGFAHGFCTLEPNCIVAYDVTNYYSAEHDRGLAWDDPDLGIAWPVTAATAVLSAKDRAQPRLAEMVAPFEYAA